MTRTMLHVNVDRNEPLALHDQVAAEMIAQMGRLPTHLRRSLTWDQGREMARHAQISMALEMPVFFCDPHSPWQRGSNENTNRLLRFWFD